MIYDNTVLHSIKSKEIDLCNLNPEKEWRFEILIQLII